MCKVYSTNVIINTKDATCAAEVNTNHTCSHTPRNCAQSKMMLILTPYPFKVREGLDIQHIQRQAFL